ncbi:MAG TPA: hypothetical protein VNW28_09070 [Chthoniobacterales bacterium]|nr:hypothetical protein [Chthoniobacterales bacterium]
MGLDSDGTRFLFAAQAGGVSFRNTAMLGRQNFFPAVGPLQQLLDLRKPGLSAVQFLADSHGYAEHLFRFLGAEEVVSLDNSDYEGAAIVTDLNAPIAATLKNRFTALLDGGCLEHVFNLPQAIKNSMEMLRVGGHFLAITPANNFCGHGFYQFSPELFFRVFSEPNGFAMRAVLTKEKERWFRVIDPEVFRGRVEIQNNRPTYLFVLAKKLETRDVFVQSPQQSDYARQWEGKAKKNMPLPAAVPSFSAKMRAILPTKWKEALRPFAANISIRHRYSCYQPIDEVKLLRGEFTID